MKFYQDRNWRYLFEKFHNGSIDAKNKINYFK